MISDEKVELLLPSVELPTSQTRRPISEGAEKWLGVPIKCLDHGFVYLVDYAGNDFSIEQAARVSYGQGTRKVSQAEVLIRYLRRHLHTTPFEMVDLKFHAKLPIFVARQWVRHRTASINEYSARYSIIADEFYIPEPEVIATQSKSNRQGRGETVSAEKAEEIRQKLTQTGNLEYDVYEDLLDDNVARELTRGPLGTFFYTQWYWKVNLHNFFHFEGLRKDPHAQYEIRVFADAMGKIAQDSWPIAWKAFEDYELNATKFSAMEKETLADLLKAKNVRFSLEEIISAAGNSGITTDREKTELVDKIREMGLLGD